MNVEAILLGTLKSDGTLELDQPVSLAAGRVRVTVEALTETRTQTVLPAPKSADVIDLFEGADDDSA